ncbi:MAG: hypothetical protein QME66_06045 [Candidatus Eisenbacteria bacterium]|nr:hypothetical protein [Candidatus Eisenbacteria bacterium]
MFRIALLCLFTLFAFPVYSYPLYPEYLPTDSWIYEELEDLWAEGHVDSIFVFTKPLTRKEIALSLLKSLREDPELKKHIGMSRLLREFSRELDDIGIDSGYKRTLPAIEIREPDMGARVFLKGDLVASKTTDDRIRLDEGSRLAGDVSVGIPPGFFLHEELSVGRVINPDRFGAEKLFNIPDFAMSVSRPYLSIDTRYMGLLLGREKLRWGPGVTGTLLISDNAPDYFMVLASKGIKGRIRGTAMTGVLDQLNGSYLSAHRVDFAVTKKFQFSLSEAARYYSPSPDPVYLISIVPYSFVPRFLYLDSGIPAGHTLGDPQRNNVMMAADFNWRPVKGAHIYGEILADDLIFEKADAPNRFGVQLGMRKVESHGKRRVTVNWELTRITNYTYSVHYSLDTLATGKTANRDFIYGGRCLGYALGPDAESYLVSVTLDHSIDFSTMLFVNFGGFGQGRLGMPWLPAMGRVSTAGLSGVSLDVYEAGMELSFMRSDSFRAKMRASYVGSLAGDARPFFAGQWVGGGQSLSGSEFMVRFEASFRK